MKEFWKSVNIWQS